jgi:hypothetical protein
VWLEGVEIRALEREDAAREADKPRSS